MAIRANVLQGVFFGVFGALTVTILGLWALMLLPLLASLASAKEDFAAFPGLPISLTAGVTSVVASFVVWLAVYSMYRRNMRLGLPTGAKAAIFALGAALSASSVLIAYLWAQSLS